MDLQILYQDDSIIVLNKPPGLVVTSTNTHDGKTLEDYLKSDLNINIDRGGVVHRLDKDTSGVIIAAKTQSALENLQDQFKQRSTKKEYLALVHGVVISKGTIDGAILRNPGNREKFIVSQDLEEGKEAVTEYEPIKRYKFSDEDYTELFLDFNNIQLRKLERLKYNQFTLVLCKPLTGRTHQIRVHLKYIGFPIVGDDKYGGKKVTRLDHRWCKRQFLHARRLEFTHPMTQERIVCEAPLPEDLLNSLTKLNGVIE